MLPGEAASRPSRRARDAGSGPIYALGSSNGLPNGDLVSDSRPQPATSVWRPSSPVPSRRPSCALLLGSRQPGYEPDRAFPLRPSCDALAHSAVLLDLSNLPRCVHPDRKRGQWLSLANHSTPPFPPPQPTQLPCPPP